MTFGLIIREENQEMEKFTLSDKAIARVVDLLQVALLTGTDIVDNLRTLQLTADGEKLTISEDDDAQFRQGIERLQEQAKEISASIGDLS